MVFLAYILYLETGTESDIDSVDSIQQNSPDTINMSQHKIIY
jgi:hypothetical protein